MRALPLLVLAGLVLSGCATRGPVRITCLGLERFQHELPESALEQQIHRDAQAWRADHGSTEDDAARAMVSGSDKDEDKALAADPMGSALLSLAQSKDRDEKMLSGGPRPVLLLSGGGQWGAFGAGFLEELHKIKGAGATDFGSSPA